MKITGPLPSLEESSPEIAIKRISNPDSFEHFLIHLAISFVNTSPDRIDDEINRALGMTGMFTGVDRAYVMKYDFEKRVVNNTHEWCADGVEPMISELQGVPMDGIEDEWLNIHLRGETVHVPDVAVLPADTPLRRILEPQGIITLFAVPMIFGGQCLGFVGFYAVKHRIEWSPERITLIRMLAEIFTSVEMDRRRIQEVQAERAKIQSMALLLKSAVEATGTAVWEYPSGGTKAFMASGWNRLLGTDWDGRWIDLAEFQSMVHPNDLGAIDRAIDPGKQSVDEHRTVEFRIRNRRNKWLVLRSWWVAQPIDEPPFLMLLGGTMDVSESARIARKQQLLREISARFIDFESYQRAMESALSEISDYCDGAAAGLFLTDGIEADFVSSSIPNEVMTDPKLFAEWNSRFVPGSDLHGCLAAGKSFFLADALAEGHRADPEDDVPRSLYFTPVFIAGILEGAIAIAYREPVHVPSPDHVEFLSSCVEILSGVLGRLRAEERLREDAENQRFILDSLDEIILLMDPGGRITFVNETACGFFGLPTAAIMGQSLSEWLKPEHPHVFAALVEADPKEKEKRNIVMRIVSRFGEQRMVSFKSRQLRNAQGKVTGILGTMSDITERYNMEAGLISKKIQAEASSDAKTLFISNFSHELRTPMHGVLGILELMIRSGRLDSKNRVLAESAHRSGLGLLRLFDDVLDIAKLERGVVELHPSVVEVRKMIEQIVTISEPDRLARNLTLDLEFTPDVPSSIVVDELRLKQIVGNLLSNAIKFTREGGLRLQLGTTVSSAGETLLRLDVEDTGIGIPEQQIQHLFTPFVRLHEDPSDSYMRGTGLGLPITRELVQIMGGRISITSEMGMGTRVSVLLPLVLPEAMGENPSGTVEMADGEARFSGLNVLVAEDNEINRILACEHLEALGCRVRAVENGLEAYKECRGQDYDAILMDCAMPVMDGYEASKKIMADEKRKRPTAIIGCTANASQGTMTKCLASGMCSVLVKPYTREQLAAALQALRLPAVPINHPDQVSNPIKLSLCGIPVVDRAVAGGLAGQLRDSMGVLAEIMTVFRDDSLRQIGEMNGLVRSGDWRKCGRIAHSLKGAASSIGAARLAALCGAIEQVCAQLEESGTSGVTGWMSSNTIEILEREREAAIVELDRQFPVA
jgi:two-component system sensor histidine kinase EvgS